MLSISGLSFDYGSTQILQNIDLQLSAGHVACLIGPNGAGKSTLLKCINLILRPQAGRVILNGKAADQYERRELARAVSYVPQQSGSGMALQVLDMVALGRSPHQGFGTKTLDREIVWDAVERLGLASLALRSFGELSGGQRQRVLIARAVAQEARLLLMDEPTSNLDPYYQLETMSVVRDIAKERNVAALVAIHDLSMAARLSDHLVMMHQGKIQAQGNWRDVLTADNLDVAFGIDAIIGSDQGWPYVIAIPKQEPSSNR